MSDDDKISYIGSGGLKPSPITIQSERNEAYNNGWNDGYAEGYAKAESVHATPWMDASLPEDDEIKDAHPLKTGDHKSYHEALRMVGARHSKYGIVDLVNWLLVRKKD